ncbi:MAG: hypothetical protein WBS20_14235 [Lysobacterales bacterium]
MKLNQCNFAFVLLFLFLLAASSSYAEEKVNPPKLFSSFDEMHVTLTGPWKTIQRNKKKDDTYPVKFTYTGADGDEQTIDMVVSLRGITRRRVCDFPPIKLHFDKEAVKGTIFRGNKSLKLVTYCDTNSKYEQYYIKEFLAYRIYNLITDFSYRTRPLMVDYEDSERDNKSITRFSFLIEDTDELAKRNKVEELTIPRIPYRDLEPVTTNRLSMFEFMIGNLDWAVTDGPKDDSCCHNSRLIGAGNDINPKYAVPYDFDSSGLVNAHYAAPPDGLRVRNIRTRLYRGFCANNDLLPETVALFKEKKADILALIQNNPHLTDSFRSDAIDYIEDFYKIIDDPKSLEKEITDKCRGRD